MTDSQQCRHPRVAWGDCPECGTFVERNRPMPSNTDTNDTTTTPTDELGGEQLGLALGELLGRVLADLEEQARQELKHDVDGDLLKLEAALPRYASSTARAGVCAWLLAQLLERYPLILQHSAERLAEQFARDAEAEAANAPTVPISVDDLGEG